MAKLNNKFEATMNACRSARITEAASRVKKSTKKLKEDTDLDTDVVDTVDDVKEEDPEGTVDDIMVITDPDMTTDEYEEVIDELQDIVDSTPEGETPFTDEYIGDDVYACPVCGNNFFSDTEMQAGDVCPVCGEEADGFVLVGEVESTDAEGEIPEEGDLDEYSDDEDLEPADAEDEMDIEESKKTRLTPTKWSINEKTLNPFLTKFIKENYKNAVSMTAKKAVLSGKTLKIECAIKFKSGKTKKTIITMENFKPAKKMRFVGKADSAFKVESKKAAPFVFEATLRGKDIQITGFKYSFVTKKEGTRVQISGKYALKESAKRNLK